MHRLLIAAAVVLASGCGSQAPQRRHAEYAIGGSLLGVMAGGLTMAALPSEKPVLIPITIGFGVLAVASTVVYIVVDSRD